MIYRGLLLALLLYMTPLSAMADMIDYPIVKMQALDKSTARTVTFEAKVGTTVEYGSLFIKVQACRKSDPLEKPESAAFLQIWEVPINSEKSEWAFSGWMFASSPALSAMDHAVYDVWVLDCLTTANKDKEAKSNDTADNLANSKELEQTKEQKPAPVSEQESKAEQEDIIDSEAAMDTEAPVTAQEQLNNPQMEQNVMDSNGVGGETDINDDAGVAEEAPQSQSDAFIIPGLPVVSPEIVNPAENPLDSVLDNVDSLLE